MAANGELCEYRNGGKCHAVLHSRPAPPHLTQRYVLVKPSSHLLCACVPIAGRVLDSLALIKPSFHPMTGANAVPHCCNAHPLPVGGKLWQVARTSRAAASWPACGISSPAWTSRRQRPPAPQPLPGQEKGRPCRRAALRSASGGAGAPRPRPGPPAPPPPHMPPAVLAQAVHCRARPLVVLVQL